ncbi:MAG TPA: hypothetical protein VL485_32770 [Ktedonobacteraceae bacterium]|jgi:hypothetical protein|nr:hypothetical protein [Ktedonobacteraceae bacterium]
MGTQSTPKPVSNGSCAFCKAEVAKNKMTQHLKSCKQRQATIAEREKNAQQPKTRLFHILAEGRYNPQYWLHFEVSASASLWSIDDFLKDMWIDDLDHLSGFTINGTNYGNDYSGDYFFLPGEVKEEEEEELSEEEAEEEINKFIDDTVAYFSAPKMLPALAAGQNLISPEWVAELKKPRSIDARVEFLKEELARIKKEGSVALRGAKDEPREVAHARYFALQSQQWIVETLLDELEDRSVDVSLERVLKVGQKFSYIYDYGSSTHINLKVLAEREGIALEKEDAIELLAQNIAPAFSCVKCGKPATTVEMDYSSSLEDSAYCDECAEENIDEGGALSITNSPRVGVL